MGHEGSGSILSELKLRGWCNNLVGGASSSAKGFGFFEIMVDLTEEVSRLFLSTYVVFDVLLNMFNIFLGV